MNSFHWVYLWLRLKGKHALQKQLYPSKKEQQYYQGALSTLQGLDGAYGKAHCLILSLSFILSKCIKNANLLSAICQSKHINSTGYLEEGQDGNFVHAA